MSEEIWHDPESMAAIELLVRRGYDPDYVCSIMEEGLRHATEAGVLK